MKIIFSASEQQVQNPRVLEVIDLLVAPELRDENCILQRPIRAIRMRNFPLKHAEIAKLNQEAIIKKIHIVLKLIFSGEGNPKPLLLLEKAALLQMIARAECIDPSIGYCCYILFRAYDEIFTQLGMHTEFTVFWFYSFDQAFSIGIIWFASKWLSRLSLVCFFLFSKKRYFCLKKHRPFICLRQF